MGQPVGIAVQLNNLVHTEGEPRWAAMVDLALAIGVLGWVTVLGLLEPGATLRVVVPLVLAVTVVARVVVLVDSSVRRSQEDADITSLAPPTQAPRQAA